MRSTKGTIDWTVAFRLELAALDLTQRDVARRIGMTDQHLSKILNGELALTPEAKARLTLAIHRDTFDAAPHVVQSAYPVALAATGD